MKNDGGYFTLGATNEQDSLNSTAPNDSLESTM